MKSKLIFLFILFSKLAMANISLPNFFSDNMVLQRNSSIKIWGWANPKEEIRITPSWDNQDYKTIANNEANWEVVIPTPKEGGPYSITFKGYNQITLKNILIGEVWLCSGQSNMEMNANWGINDGEKEAAKATNTNIRFFSVEKSSSESPQQNLLGSWEICSPEVMKKNSAVAYFFANRIKEELKNVPIGLMIAAWGATSAEVWMPKNVFDNDSQLFEASKKINPNEYCPVGNAKTFNTMINPLVGYKIRGVLWYQGESNVGSTIYDKTFTTLISSWRNLWKEDFPFYFVQIAPYKIENDNYSSVQIRNFQRKTLSLLPNTQMAITSDISTTDDIHPKDKKSVGVRLANLALSNVYNAYSKLANGPLLKEIKVEKNKIFVYFDYADGLYFKDSNSNQFEVAGADNIFFPVVATIKKNKVILSCKNVRKPSRVRFAWKNESQSQLFNNANLPASSFISE